MRILSLFLLGLVLAGCWGEAPGAAGRAVYRQGVDALDAGDYDKALQYLTDAQRLRPDDPYVALDLGVTYQALGKNGEARSAYEKAIETGKGVVPVRVTDPRAAGKSLAEIAADNLNFIPH